MATKTIRAPIVDTAFPVLAFLVETTTGQVAPDPAGYVMSSAEDQIWDISVTEGCVGIYRLDVRNGDGEKVALGYVWIESDTATTFIASADYNTVLLRQALNGVPANVANIVIDTNELQTDWTDGGRLDTILDGVQGKTDTIGSGAAVVPSPTTDAGELSDIIIGDDYNDANNRAFIWEFDAIPGFSIGSCDGRFGVEHPEASVQKFLVDSGTANITDVGGGRWQVKFEVDKAVTQNLIEGAYDYSVEIHESGEEITVARNLTPRDRVRLVTKQTHE